MGCFLDRGFVGLRLLLNLSLLVSLNCLSCLINVISDLNVQFWYCTTVLSFLFNFCIAACQSRSLLNIIYNGWFDGVILKADCEIACLANTTFSVPHAALNRICCEGHSVTPIHPCMLTLSEYHWNVSRCFMKSGGNSRIAVSSSLSSIAPL